MGGRGASSGMSKNGKKYATEYKSLLTYGNIKFVIRLGNSAAAPMETMTKNRVYVTLTPNGEPKYISYYDKDNKRKKQIDLHKPHEGVLPHTHHGYEHRENDSLKGFAKPTDKENKMIDLVQKIWEEKKENAWSRWERFSKNDLG